ncbi:MAG: hypothetical protein AABW73_02550 [Nanoarchaeota archaeon]
MVIDRLDPGELVKALATIKDGGFSVVGSKNRKGLSAEVVNGNPVLRANIRYDDPKGSSITVYAEGKKTYEDQLRFAHFRGIVQRAGIPVSYLKHGYSDSGRPSL